MDTHTYRHLQAQIHTHVAASLPELIKMMQNAMLQ